MVLSATARDDAMEVTIRNGSWYGLASAGYEDGGCGGSDPEACLGR